jgi:hypothetical protein
MAESKTTTIRRKKKAVASLPVATENQIPEKKEVATVAPIEKDESKAKADPVPSIAQTKHIKGVDTRDRYVKVVAIKNSRGRLGSTRFDIKDGETYSFDAELAKWLIQTGRAK